MDRTTVAHCPFDFNPYAPETVDDPYPEYARLREMGTPTYSVTLDSWVVADYSSVKHVLGDATTFSSAVFANPVNSLTPAVIEVLKGGYRISPPAVASDGDRHRRLRHPYNIAFSPARSRQFSSFVDAVIASHINRIKDHRSAEIISDLVTPVTLEVILRAMGVGPENIESARIWSEHLVTFFFRPVSEPELIEAASGLVALHQFLGGLIENRREHPGDDVISAMVHETGPDQEPFTTGEMVNALAGAVMAGHKTTIDGLGNGLVALLHPRTNWEAVVADRDNLDTWMDEFLRFDSPLQGLRRVTTRDVTINGVRIPAGQTIHVLIGSANRDSKVFVQPDEIRVGRTNANRHLAYGYGVHRCPGAPLAQLEGTKLIAALVDNFPNLQLDPTRLERRSASLLFRGYSQIPVTW